MSKHAQQYYKCPTILIINSTRIVSANYTHRCFAQDEWLNKEYIYIAFKAFNALLLRFQGGRVVSLAPLTNQYFQNSFTFKTIDLLFILQFQKFHKIFARTTLKQTKLHLVYVAFLVLARHSSKTIVPHFLISYLLLLLLIGLINLHFSLENTNIITLITEVRLEKKLLALLARIKFPVNQFILLRTLRILLYETILANIALIQHILLFAYFVRTSIYESSFQVTIWKINNILTRLAYYVLEGILARTSYKLTLLHALLKVK